MRKEDGVTLVTVIVMVIIIGIIAVTSVLSGTHILDESKKEAKLQNQLAVETAVSRYSAQIATAGVLSPANVKLPGIQNPMLEHVYKDATGVEIVEEKNVGKDWYLLLEDSLEEIGVTYADENYLVNYKQNIVIPLSSTDNVFDIIGFYEQNQ